MRMFHLVDLRPLDLEEFQLHAAQFTTAFFKAEHCCPAYCSQEGLFRLLLPPLCGARDIMTGSDIWTDSNIDFVTVTGRRYCGSVVIHAFGPLAKPRLGNDNLGAGLPGVRARRHIWKIRALLRHFEKSLFCRKHLEDKNAFCG
jgi:hypothetical protein